jgi:hypothetical protein
MLRKRLTKLKMALTLFTLRLSGRSQNRMLKLPVSGWIIFTAALFFFYFNKLRTKPYCLYFPVRLPQNLSTSREASLFLPIASLAYICYLTRPHRDRP